MDKNKIDEFATQSRRQLIENLTYEANRIGITKEEIYEPTNTAEDMQTFTTAGVTNTIYGKQIEQRDQLVKEIQNNGFDQTIEKIAYTWFNRIIAIRYMEVNNYLPTHTRVLSSITPGQKEPDIITEALNIDLGYSSEDTEKIIQYKEENKTDELFKLLFIKQCNKLNEILPELFEKIDDYTEILFNIQLSNPENIINKLVTSIPEEDFTNQVEIIGWIYQYYNAELKEDTDEKINKNNYKVGKERLPAKTQLFTPDWIVKYMVENSLGKLWVETHENSEIQKTWKYYLTEVEQSVEVKKQIDETKIISGNLEPEGIKILDPSMGSGHIIAYVFDVLMQIYISKGFTQKEAVINILENNIYGIDIDDRAYQLAYFTIMMKARSYYKRILNKNIKPNLLSIKETINITNDLIEMIQIQFEDSSQEILKLIDIFRNGKTLGSLIKIDDEIDLDKLELKINMLLNQSSNDLMLVNHINEIKLLSQIIYQSKILKNKYDIVITNPPYLNIAHVEPNLKSFLTKYYNDSKNDLCTAFIERNYDFLKNEAYLSMITQQTFMFVKRYKNFREKFLNHTIISMMQLGSKAFEEIKGEVVQTVSFIQKNQKIGGYNSHFIKLTDYDVHSKEKQFFKDKNSFFSKQENYSLIENSPITFWASNTVYQIFKLNKKIKDYIDYTGSFHKTANNKKYLRYFWEIDCTTFKYWKHYNKGGKSRKWYGNNELLVKWDESSITYYKEHKTANLFKEKFWNKEGITWTALTSNDFNSRYFEKGFISDFKGASIYPQISLKYMLGYMNSSVFNYLLKLLVPNMDYNIGQVVSIPFIFPEDYTYVEKLVEENIRISKKYWDFSEQSFNFHKNYLVSNILFNILEKQYEFIKKEYQLDFKRLKHNEIEINNYFVKLFNLKEEIPVNVDDSDINLFKFDGRVFSDLISYIIGCLFGRYSLDEDGLIFAGGNFDITRYKSIKPDVDNIIPVLDEEYFDDDVVNQIVNFIKVAIGEDNLNENLDFIAECLDVKGKTSREVIRNYMIKNFYSNHVSMYQKCPIYWMFDSGKQNAFKCLIYMHRYEPDLVSRIRHDYLHKTQRAIEENIKEQDNIIQNSENKSNVNKANKEKTKLVKQLDEIKLYDLALYHVASESIELDLDDGVKVNYAKFQNIEVVDPNTNKTKKINLLKKL